MTTLPYEVCFKSRVPFSYFADFVRTAGERLTRRYGIGNTPPTLTYGPGVENIDIGLQKDTNLGKSDRPKILSLKVEAFNLFNHFNPSNPNTTLNLNCQAVGGFCTSGGANTNAAFGTITGAQIRARQMSLTLRFRF